MKKIQIYYTPEFQKLWRKLPDTVKNPFHPQLKTHKLKGVLSGFFSFSIDYHYRIVFHFEEDKIYFDAVGTHAIYR